MLYVLQQHPDAEAALRTGKGVPQEDRFLASLWRYCGSMDKDEDEAATEDGAEDRSRDARPPKAVGLRGPPRRTAIDICRICRWI